MFPSLFFQFLLYCTGPRTLGNLAISVYRCSSINLYDASIFLLRGEYIKPRGKKLHLMFFFLFVGLALPFKYGELA